MVVGLFTCSACVFDVVGAGYAFCSFVASARFTALGGLLFLEKKNIFPCGFVFLFPRKLKRVCLLPVAPRCE